MLFRSIFYNLDSTLMKEEVSKSKEENPTEYRPLSERNMQRIVTPSNDISPEQTARYGQRKREREREREIDR